MLGFYSDNNSCKDCSSNSLKCKGPNKSELCSFGYYLTQDSSCKAC